MEIIVSLRFLEEMKFMVPWFWIVFLKNQNKLVSGFLIFFEMNGSLKIQRTAQTLVHT
jgi:hypothetical protein